LIDISVPKDITRYYKIGFHFSCSAPMRYIVRKFAPRGVFVLTVWSFFAWKITSSRKRCIIPPQRHWLTFCLYM